MINAVEYKAGMEQLFSSEIVPEKLHLYNPVELTKSIMSIIPVHVGFDMSNWKEVDELLGIYSAIYYYVARLYTASIHYVRRAKEKPDLDRARDYRDSFEMILKVVKMQYDALSRRMTLKIENK